eukprot:6189894-Pleurochrysis_carterae.AAC.4
MKVEHSSSWQRTHFTSTRFCWRAHFVLPPPKMSHQQAMAYAYRVELLRYAAVYLGHPST